MESVYVHDCGGYQMRFCIRVDDLGWTPRPITRGNPAKHPDAGLVLAQKFHAAMQGLPYLGGVIPACVDNEGQAWLQSKPEGLTVALHGLSHSTYRGVASEYHGLNLEQCRARIAAGRSILAECGHEVTDFIPPFNALEPDLIEALWHEGLRVIWGAISNWPTPPQPYPMNRMLFVPSWKPLYAATRWQIGKEDVPLDGVIQGLKGQPGKAVITLHLPWEASRSAEFDGVKWLVNEIGEQVITIGEYLK